MIGAVSILDLSIVRAPVPAGSEEQIIEDPQSQARRD